MKPQLPQDGFYHQAKVLGYLDIKLDQESRSPSVWRIVLEELVDGIAEGPRTRQLQGVPEVCVKGPTNHLHELLSRYGCMHSRRSHTHVCIYIYAHTYVHVQTRVCMFESKRISGPTVHVQRWLCKQREELNGYPLSTAWALDPPGELLPDQLQTAEENLG